MATAVVGCDGHDDDDDEVVVDVEDDDVTAAKNIMADSIMAVAVVLAMDDDVNGIDGASAVSCRRRRRWPCRCRRQAGVGSSIVGIDGVCEE